VARIAPVGYEDRLSIIDHLDELRTRLIWCVAAFIVAFSFCYWQNDRLLNIVNQPLYRSQHLTDNGKRKDPLEQNAVFTRKVGAAAQDASAAVVAQQRALNAVAGDGRVSRATRAALQASQQASAAAAKSLAEAAKATPTDQQRRPITLGVTEPFVTTFTVAGYAALLLCLPFILYQAYAFILPAFTPDEKRHVVPILLMVPCLFAAGVAFGYFVALPRAVDFLQNFNDQSFDILLQAKDYYRFSVTLLLVIGLLFQIPVGVLAVTRLGLVSAKRLAQSRGYVILAIAVVAAVATPTPDPVTMLVAMAPLVVLWEASVLIARIVERRRPKDDEDDDDSGGGGDDDEHEPPADDDLSAWEGDLAPRPTLS
jgi:sec-independent protein translocase protein TatC